MTALFYEIQNCNSRFKISFVVAVVFLYQSGICDRYLLAHFSTGVNI